jgi:gliding motility-associated-like protein
MKKILILVAIILASSGQGYAQLTQLTHFAGPMAYGGVTVTVTPGGGCNTTGGGLCFGPPIEYWTGPWCGIPSWYDYTFSVPVFQIQVRPWGINGGPLNAGEFVRLYINGAPHVLQPSEVLSYTDCMPGGGPCYISSLGDFMGPVGTSGDYNGGEFLVPICTGITSCRVYTNDLAGGSAYWIWFDPTRPPSCVQATNNSPCIGDPLDLFLIGDSTGATYSWTGPGGFTSTLQDPIIFPSTFADSGWYKVIRIAGPVADTDSTFVHIYPLPVVHATSNAPLCAGPIDTLDLFANPPAAGETFSWTGPLGFTSTMEYPILPSFSTVDTGFYTVVATTMYGCKAEDSTHVTVVTPPPAPMITGPTSYCQGMPFIAFTVTGYTGTLEWYTTATGGTPTTIAPTVNTSIPGYTTVWVSQRIGSCESPRATYTVRVITTPGAPVVTGPTEYCQYIGPYVPLAATHTATGILEWYTVATGGSPSLTEPTVNINIPGTTDFWVSQVDSGCESARAHAAVVVHPKPAPPIVTPEQYCLNAPATPLKIVPSGAGDLLTYFGAGIPTGGTTSDPTPSTVVLGYVIDSANEKTSFGCISNMAIDTVLIKPIPSVPVTRDTIYCQFTQAPALTADSTPGDRLKWYIMGTLLPHAPTPSNNLPGDSTWYVSQILNLCESDSAPLKVTTIYKPSFTITASKPWVCQFDSLSLAYNGPTLNNPAYIWSIPFGSYYATLDGEVLSKAQDSIIMVRFDSLTLQNTVQLTVTDNNGFCKGDASIRIPIIPKPYASSYSKRDVCVGDTITLALSVRSDEASQFTWTVDNTPFATSSALNILAANANSGGPYSISWNDSGRHVITVTTATEQGCKSLPSYDTVDVHTMPDASFKVTTRPGMLCMEDSVLFTANTNNYNYAYEWAPAHFFSNINQPVIWGRVEQEKSIITLTVTDPFGCIASNSVEIDPATCCTVNFPNAFSPDGDGVNDFFKPIFAGYHRFHIFRIANRWGQTVYETTNDKMNWDGTYNGVPQDIGVYYYYIKFDCGGNTMEQTGDVTLIR